MIDAVPVQMEQSSFLVGSSLDYRDRASQETIEEYLVLLEAEVMKIQESLNLSTPEKPKLTQKELSMWLNF